MTLTVTMDHPDYPRGTEFDLSGVGLIKNGESFTLTDAQLEAFEQSQGYSLEKSLREDPLYKVTKSKGGDDK